MWVFLLILLFKIALATWDTLQFPVNFSVSFSDCIRMSVEILLEIVLNVSSEICEVYNMISAVFFFLFSLFLAALSIYCSTQALPLSSCGKKGLILVVVHGFLIEVAFFCCRRFSCCGTQALGCSGSVVVSRGLRWHMGLIAPWHVGS